MRSSARRSAATSTAAPWPPPSTRRAAAPALTPTRAALRIRGTLRQSRRCEQCHNTVACCAGMSFAQRPPPAAPRPRSLARPCRTAGGCLPRPQRAPRAPYCHCRGVKHTARQQKALACVNAHAPNTACGARCGLPVPRARASGSAAGGPAPGPKAPAATGRNPPLHGARLPRGTHPCAQSQHRQQQSKSPARAPRGPHPSWHPPW